MLLPEPSQWRGPMVLPEGALETSKYWAAHEFGGAPVH